MVQLRTTPPELVSLLLVGALVACGGSGESPSGDIRAAPEPPTREAAAGGAEKTPDAAAAAPTAGHHRLGEPLADPSRYYGLYASADRPDRQWFVAEAKRPAYAEQAPEVPPGHLALGAMFGDVAPWHLKTLSETEFEQAWVSDHQPEPVSIEFELDDDGRAVALRFTNEQYASLGRLERQADLPEGWE
ncbi:MAG: hypothetical protein WBG93_04280 [Thermoanaerobaculia bacterium]